MCTVSYLPLGDADFILTSNRDENPKRKTLAPQEYNDEGVLLTYPKDEVAGGTWIGLSEKKRLICLLNGGLKNHVRAKSYRLSRGVIVKQFLKVGGVVAYAKEIDLNNIEPFTIVLVDWEDQLKVYELVWTGIEKRFQELENKPHIWSSSTLYTEEMKQLRSNWFSDWLLDREEFLQQDIVAFHSDDTIGTTDTSLKMKRERVETVSITSVVKKKEKVSMEYLDF
ncbi:NRDE family protein [Tenacibaculum sp. M341]|uniref:NRDE family protein n=1 Tax=Tenacibaculum sp. M341 TaxID=2530339 RepID=UPI00105249CE|nr:NRDE family protein [Tenacibaculum sp. M341]TCI94314.1 hypothetical protein EYW44_02930 [Tenacibaculum sp. M341]